MGGNAYRQCPFCQQSALLRHFSGVIIQIRRSSILDPGLVRRFTGLAFVQVAHQFHLFVFDHFTDVHPDKIAVRRVMIVGVGKIVDGWLHRGKYAGDLGNGEGDRMGAMRHIEFRR